MIKNALISVSDKTGVIEFAKELEELGIEIISTGGTEKALKDNGVNTVNISDITGFPECLDGRVKTLHPKVHAGILAVRDNKEHMRELEELNIDTIDMVVVNLYPFEETIKKDNATFEDAIENIDIGGPTMLRSAAKNYKDVIVIIDPRDYERVISEIKQNNNVSEKTRLELAFKVFNHTAFYDSLIASYLKDKSNINGFLDTVTYGYEKVQELRYGENPHQRAAFYKEPIQYGGNLVSATQLHGKELSFNNINDSNAAIGLLKEFDELACIAVKHGNPCGVGVGDNTYKAYMKAYEADPVSIFGGIVVFNSTVDKDTAAEINKIFIEIVIAPKFTDEAIEILESKKNIRILELNCKPSPKVVMEDIKKVNGGILIQDIDDKDYANLSVVTERKPTDKEMKEMLFAWKIVKHVKSNAIVLSKDSMTIGVGPGQVNRIGALEIAIRQAGDKAKGSVMASDAFFPFSDVVEAAAKAGITAIIQPGGSIRDQDSIDACNKYNIAMVFTEMRHFKH
jgi:phosphoribosylaminoimidazolecarboxamide formyltransferase/IMP cyclohydrolase